MSNQEEEIILLPIAPIGASFRRLWNYLTVKSPHQISKILLRMNPERLFRFLEFMHHICLHDMSIQSSQRLLEHYQTILMCCPRLILTEYLFSIDEQCRINILQHCDVIWTMYFIGLIEIGHEINVHIVLHDLTRIHDNFFVFNLVLLIAREISNQDLPLQLRERIYQFVYQNPQMVSMIVQRENEEASANFEQLFDQMNQWSQNVSQQNGFGYVHQWMTGDLQIVLEPEPQPEHQAVDAEAFVCRTFQQLPSLAPDCVYQCGICYCGPDDTNEDQSIKVFRSMNCCPQQMCCHDCLVKQAIMCNTPDSEFKNTRVFICPFARHETDFFPQNPDDLEENYKIEMIEQNN
jgi:hypothetical protein